MPQAEGLALRQLAASRFRLLDVVPCLGPAAIHHEYRDADRFARGPLRGAKRPTVVSAH